MRAFTVAITSKYVNSLLKDFVVCCGVRSVVATVVESSISFDKSFVSAK